MWESPSVRYCISQNPNGGPLKQNLPVKRVVHVQGCCADKYCANQSMSEWEQCSVIIRIVATTDTVISVYCGELYQLYVLCLVRCCGLADTSGNDRVVGRHLLPATNVQQVDTVFRTATDIRWCTVMLRITGGVWQFLTPELVIFESPSRTPMYDIECIYYYFSNGISMLQTFYTRLCGYW